MNKIRKQLMELTIDDITRYPIWEFCIDEEDVEGQDETTIRPRNDIKVADFNKGMFVIKTAFTSNNNQKYLGYATPSEELDLGIIQPTIINKKGAHIGFWYGSVGPSQEDLDESYSSLETDCNKLFPLKYASEVNTTGIKIEGSIEGFYYVHQFLGVETIRIKK